MANCRLCGGDKVVTCPKCNGTGTIDGEACYLCKGNSGGAAKTTVTCPRCNGSGED